MKNNKYNHINCDLQILEGKLKHQKQQFYCKKHKVKICRCGIEWGHHAEYKKKEREYQWNKTEETEKAINFKQMYTARKNKRNYKNKERYIETDITQANILYYDQRKT